MSERIEFKFQGKLSDEHQLDFYEAGRFQYGTARLMVKLDQFRRTGRFPKKITSSSNTGIVLSGQENGSFVISTLVSFLQAGGTEFLGQTALSTLWAYAAERVLNKADTEDIRSSLEDSPQLLETFNNHIAETAQQNHDTLDLLRRSFEQNQITNNKVQELYERLLAEQGREEVLSDNREQLQNITPEQDAKLIAMASPIMRDIGVVMRKSASTMTISSNENINENQKKIIFFNKKIADEVNTTIVDDRTTLILVRIIQYNVETGWGKLRTAEAENLISFNVPADRKEVVQGELIDALDRGGHQLDTYAEAFIVRSRSRVMTRMIITNVHDLDAIEHNNQHHE